MSSVTLPRWRGSGRPSPSRCATCARIWRARPSSSRRCGAAAAGAWCSRRPARSTARGEPAPTWRRWRRSARTTRACARPRRMPPPSAPARCCARPTAICSASAPPACASSPCTARASGPTWRSTSSCARSRRAGRSTSTATARAAATTATSTTPCAAWWRRASASSRASHQIYNLGGTTTTSLAELVALIEEVVGKSALLDRQPDQPGDVPITFADITGAARDLGYAPATRIEDGVRAFWRWVQEEDRAGRPIA